MLRHLFTKLGTGLMAVGAGAAIILSQMKLSASQNLPSLTQPQNNLLRKDLLEGTRTENEKWVNFSLTQSNWKIDNFAKRSNLLAQSAPQPNPQPSAGSRETLIPESLNPSANPLLFPTKPEEVRIQTLQPITLQQALSLARRNNRQLQIATLTLEGSRASLREALAAEYPTLGFQTDLTRTDSASGELSARRQANLPETGTQSNQSTVSTTLNGTLQLNYDLYTSGRRSGLIRAAEEQVRFDELDVERQSEQIRLDVTNAYYDLQEADAQADIAQAAVTEAARSLRDAQLQEQAGLGTRFDVLRAEVQLATANQDLTRARSQQSINRRQLVQLLSLAQTVDVTAADSINVAGSWQIPLDQSIILALKNRAELEQQLARRNISEQQQQVALSAERPQISLFSNYNVVDVFKDGTGPADGLSVGAQFRWNFYDGGVARARADQQKANQAIAETQFANTRNQIRFQVEQAYFNLNSGQQNIQTASKAVTQADESLRLARLRFNAGVGTQTDVISAQTELTRARVNRLRAILDYNRALASLQRAVSNLPSGNLFDTQ